ncbi:unnamed protein product [Arctia plantaginis]|uniref:Uncharacterized protein n=1 Tax=Arctia plantaginis TaxID=874455 RepID=A0A8S0ZZE2_ARCPL|nr:unnamed protein product [Arctia plantaginis]
MTLSGSFNDPLSKTDTVDNSINLNSLYCSHLWANSHIRNAIIAAPYEDRNITYCYTCKGKIRKYEVKSPKSFMPQTHSTPNKEITILKEDLPINGQENSLENKKTEEFRSLDNSISKDPASTIVESKQRIPSISQQIDSSFRQKYISYEMEPRCVRRQRLRKTLKGFGCIVNFTMTDNPLKKRTQIQACSISIMIVAIVIISFILVNFTHPNFKAVANITSTSVVPTKVNFNKTVSANTNVYSELLSEAQTKVAESYFTTTVSTSNAITNNITQTSVLSKIRKNIRTYPKNSKEELTGVPKDINNRDVSQRFCSCQRNEICMLDENSGTSVCRKPIDEEDPTGCGGLCALETEACQLVDKARGVRVCRLLTLVTCSPKEWRCRNGLCVSAEARCDGSIQCYDRSDEMYCDCDLTKQFRCGHFISCFSQTKLCDGVIDCWDGYDEVNCTVECPDDQFTCNSGQCIAASRFCDGLADCMDGSDEPDGCGGNCGTHEIQCRNQRCVPRTVHCDGRDNCGDASDELHCL